MHISKITLGTAQLGLDYGVANQDGKPNQGLFFKSPENLPKTLKIAKEPLVKLRKLTDKYNIDIASLALLFVRDILEIDSLVIGMENIEQVSYNLKTLNKKPLPEDLISEILLAIK